MPDVKISELPTKTIAGTDMVPVVDTGATTTSRVTAADIAGLVTDASQLTTGTLPDARLSADVVLTGDSRLSDARTPTAHKSSHATGGSDALSPSDIGAANASHTHAASTDITGLSTVATSGSYNDLTDKPAASSGISIATVWALS